MSKKSEQLNLSLTPHVMGRLRGHYRRTGIKPTEFGRAAVVEKLASDQPMSAEAEALAKCRAAGVDPIAALLDAATAALSA